jgi:Cell division protein FtsQ
MTRAAPGGALREGRSRLRPVRHVTSARPAERDAGPDGDRWPGQPLAVPIPLVPRARRRRRRRRLLVAGGAAALAVAAWAGFASPVRSGGTPPVELGGAGTAVRLPAIAVRVDDGVRVFDATGAELGPARSAPPGVPVVDVEPAALAPPTLLAVLRVRRELPTALLGEIAQSGATSRDGVWFRLHDGTRVEWGSPLDAAAKAPALAALRRTVPAGRQATIDVSAATAPAVSW